MRSETVRQILSEVSEETKQKVRETANRLVMGTNEFLELEENKGLSTKALLRKFAKIHVKLANEHAVNFAKWMHTDTTYIGLGKYRVINDENHYDINQILEIYNETFTQK